AILTASWAVGVAVRHDWIDRIKFADGFAIDPAGFNQEDLDAVRKLDFITDTCELNRLPVEITDQQVFGIEGIYSKNAMGIGFDPEIFFSLNAIDWVEGSLVEALPALQKGDGVLVADRFQTAKGYRVGDSITLKVGRAEKVFSIVGIVSSAGLDLATQMFGVRDLYSEFAVSTVFIDRQVVGDVFGNQEVHLLQANLVENISDQEAELRIAEAAPGVVFRSGRWILDTIDDISRTSMGIMTSVAFGALILATLATGSVVAANLRGRAFEYGVMRSVGASRSAVARIIFGEAIILSMTAIVMGVTLGMHFANFDRMHYAGLVGIELRPRPVAGPTTLG
ncbi:MAG: ABC transporter permease, partial [Planctomycetota bacterium]